MDEDVRRRVEKLEVDTYYGQGRDNPSLTTRMALAEGEIADVKETVDEIRKDSKATRNMVLAAILALVGEIIVTVLAKWVHL